ncbi:hypothetical protein [Actinoalloteichus hymeniacidonis]|uniref:Uncharacterized protein n=1 Tax=Actinoalloteichus hymeniacidonis TaxID=340345 RepID=A0AAC9MX05_9PSEU|nr:hypothetical protein [Actinoalloteichus hymeniacidonis]AOS61546.1 hypothetical protein TL08_03570 [Actinoalloteichus hymeniacidonis]MBB5910446.1 hypothetical protein [Actinoalloteichus hymeniacidonis]
MPVTEIVEQLRRAYDLLTEALRSTAVADLAIIEGHEVFAGATKGSIWPQVAQIHRLAHSAADEVRLSEAALRGAQEIIDAYCWEIAGHGLARAEVGAGTALPSGQPGYNVKDHYAEWIDELRGKGMHVEPDAVVRMIRLRNGRLVWLERGHSDGGLEHILRRSRVRDFERSGISRDEIVNLVFVALEEGIKVGYIGQDRPVYEVAYGGRFRRVAITVRDGFIVGAMPVPLGRRVRARLHRS